MTSEEFKAILEDKTITVSWQDNKLWKGCQIITKYISKNNEIITRADHNFIYTIDIEQLCQAGITKEDVTQLRKLNWTTKDGYLVYYIRCSFYMEIIMSKAYSTTELISYMSSLNLDDCEKCNEINRRLACYDDLLDACKSSLSLLQWIVENVPDTDLQSNVLRLEGAIAKTKKQAASKPTLTYSIVKESSFHHYKRSLSIRLNGEVSEDTLRAIALELKAKETKAFERTFICYYLPNMKVDSGAWATTHFNPDLEVRFMPSNIQS